MAKGAVRIARTGSLVVFAMAALAAPRSRWAAAQEERPRELTFCCAPGNDLYRLVVAREPATRRIEDPAGAIAAAPEGGGVLILAPGYPQRPTQLDANLLDAAARRGLRLYVEFPATLPGIAVGPVRRAHWERAVVASGAFGPALERMRILAIHGCRFTAIPQRAAHIVLARVAGFDRAVYGLPERTVPILFEHPRGDLLVASTKLSCFVTARYAPSEAWEPIWRMVLAWLRPNTAPPRLRWVPAVRPSYGESDQLPRDVEIAALRRGIEWYFNARMLIHREWSEVYDQRASGWKDRVGPAPERRWPCGDGSLGVLEGVQSTIGPDGSQLARWWRRHDCNGEVAGAMALAGAALQEISYERVGARICDYLYTKSILTGGKRADPKSASYGLIGWNDVPHYSGGLDGYGVYYADDNARGLMGVLAAAAVLKTDRFDERALRALLANLRVAGRLGFQPNRIDEGPLERSGWRHYFASRSVQYRPHYQAYMWACYLWAYRATGFELFLERARTAIRMTMQAYPQGWRWTNGIQQERARMLLPLAWLVRLEDTAEHRAWLMRIAREMLAAQDACGAIREELGPPGRGDYGPPGSNASYGTNEATLIQANGDPLVDLLYTANFALVGLHEAAAATGEALYREAEERLVRFLCRIQVRSEAHPELDGGWFRGFDFERWEYWASNADAGWGAWSIETGWTQGWIVAVLALRALHSSLWERTAGSRMGRHLDRIRPAMLPDEVLEKAHRDRRKRSDPQVGSWPAPAKSSVLDRGPSTRHHRRVDPHHAVLETR